MKLLKFVPMTAVALSFVFTHAAQVHAQEPTAKVESKQETKIEKKQEAADKASGMDKECDCCNDKKNSDKDRKKCCKKCKMNRTHNAVKESDMGMKQKADRPKDGKSI